MQEFRCKTCDALIDLSTAKDGVVECKFCHNVYTVPTAKGDVEEQLRIAENELDGCDFERAYTAYAKAAQIEPKEPEAHFGLALASFKIQYIRDTKDPKHKRLQPICREVTDKQFSDSKHYLKALSLATGEQKKVYERRADEIDAIGKEFYRLKKSGLRYDCFICVKVSDENGGNTQDSHEALKLYNYLKKQGYSPFYSEEEMQGRVGVDYAALILYALYTSECMLVVCSDEDYLLTPWVRNEYTQFGELMEGGRKDADAIAIVFKGKPIQNLPGRKGKLQGVSLNSATAYVEITSYVDKHTPEARARKLKEDAEAKLKELEKAKQAAEQARLLEEQESRLKEMQAQLAALSEQSKKKEEPKPAKDNTDELAALKAEFEAKLKELSKPAPQPKATTTVKLSDNLSGDELLAALEKAQKDKAEREEAERKKKEEAERKAWAEKRDAERAAQKKAEEERKKAEEEFKKTYLQVGETVTIGQIGKYKIEWEVRKLSGDTAVLVSKHILSTQPGDACPLQYDPRKRRHYVDTSKRHSYIKYWIDNELTKAFTEEERAFFHGSQSFRLLTKGDVEELFPEKSSRSKHPIDKPSTHSGCYWWLDNWQPPDNPETRYACKVPRQYCVSSSGNVAGETVYEKSYGVVLKAYISSKRSDNRDLYDPVKIAERKAARIAEEKARAEAAEKAAKQEAEERRIIAEKEAAERAIKEAEKARLKAQRKAQEEKDRPIREMAERAFAERQKRLAEEKQRELELHPTLSNYREDEFLIRKGSVKNPNAVGEQALLIEYTGKRNDIVIPDGVTCIAILAFNKTSEIITAVTLPASVTVLGEYAGVVNPFRACKNLESITMQSGNPKFHMGDNCLIETATGRLVAGCKKSVIPSDGSIKIIGSQAFQNAAFTDLTIPNGVESIEYDAFLGCSALTNVTVPDSVVTLEFGAFSFCPALKTVTMPKALKKFVKTAFDKKGKGIKFTFTK